MVSTQTILAKNQKDLAKKVVNNKKAYVKTSKLQQANKKKTKIQVLEASPPKQSREETLISIDEDEEEREEYPLIKKKPRCPKPIITNESSQI